jgi:hypothetical protein
MGDVLIRGLSAAAVARIARPVTQGVPASAVRARGHSEPGATHDDTRGPAPATTNWIIEKSAYTGLSGSPDAPAWVGRIGHSFRTGQQARDQMSSPPLASMPIEYLTLAVEDRAVQAQLLHADRGQHRGTAIPDLIAAATAELAELTLLALDEDFDLIARVTAQPVERLQS